jgi:hypothetical protein
MKIDGTSHCGGIRYEAEINPDYVARIVRICQAALAA